jgi:hypothetical protein
LISQSRGLGDVYKRQELLEENEYLRTEIAFLKKLRALAQNGKKPKP